MWMALVPWQVAVGFFFICSDPSLLALRTDPANLFDDGSPREFLQMVSRVIAPLHGPHAGTAPLASALAAVGFAAALAATLVVLGAVEVAIAAFFTPLLAFVAIVELVLRWFGWVRSTAGAEEDMDEDEEAVYMGAGAEKMASKLGATHEEARPIIAVNPS